MKRPLLVLLAGLVTAGVVACGGKAAPETAPAPQANADSIAAAEKARQDSIAAAEAAGMAMVTTGIRHFRH